MGRRRIWLIIIGILIAGVSITWAVERFVSTRGVDTAAVVGFEADALPQGPVDAGNPYAAENKMRAAGNAGSTDSGRCRSQCPCNGRE